nr:hypothetical protein [Sphingobacterium sp. InxBP1]
MGAVVLFEYRLHLVLGKERIEQGEHLLLFALVKLFDILYPFYGPAVEGCYWHRRQGSVTPSAEVIFFAASMEGTASPRSYLPIISRGAPFCFCKVALRPANRSIKK